MSNLLLRLPVLGMAFAASLLWAQNSTGSISGTVLDPNMAVVPKANLKVANDATGIVRLGETGSLGEYVVALLPSGIYTVEVQKDGFRTASLPGIEVRVDEAV